MTWIYCVITVQPWLLGEFRQAKPWRVRFYIIISYLDPHWLFGEFDQAKPWHDLGLHFLLRFYLGFSGNSIKQSLSMTRTYILIFYLVRPWLSRAFTLSRDLNCFESPPSSWASTFGSRLACDKQLPRCGPRKGVTL